MIDRELNGRDIIAVPLAEESDMRIGYITHHRGLLSRLGNTYLEALAKHMNVKHPERKLERRGRFNELGKNGEMMFDADQIIKRHMRKIGEKRN